LIGAKIKKIGILCCEKILNLQLSLYGNYRRGVKEHKEKEVALST
jgi:hypothetical protein